MTLYGEIQLVHNLLVRNVLLENDRVEMLVGAGGILYCHMLFKEWVHGICHTSQLGRI